MTPNAHFYGSAAFGILMMYSERAGRFVSITAWHTQTMDGVALRSAKMVLTDAHGEPFPYVIGAGLYPGHRTVHLRVSPLTARVLEAAGSGHYCWLEPDVSRVDPLRTEPGELLWRLAPDPPKNELLGLLTTWTRTDMLMGVFIGRCADGTHAMDATCALADAKTMLDRLCEADEIDQPDQPDQPDQLQLPPPPPPPPAGGSGRGPRARQNVCIELRAMQQTNVASPLCRHTGTEQGGDIENPQLARCSYTGACSATGQWLPPGHEVAITGRVFRVGERQADGSQPLYPVCLQSRTGSVFRPAIEPLSSDVITHGN